jgi:hypothetical protein
VPIWGGSVTDVSIEVTTGGSIAINQIISIVALGALSRLPKANWLTNLARHNDGTQILEVLTDLLINNWSEVPSSLTWGNYTPATETWANAQNVGLGEIDTPGNYDLSARSADPIDVYSLVSALATSGLGYIYEDAYGRISYADSTHRTQYLATNGYVDVSAAEALAQGIKIQTRSGDVRNDVTIKYGANSNNGDGTTNARRYMRRVGRTGARGSGTLRDKFVIKCGTNVKSGNQTELDSHGSFALCSDGSVYMWGWNNYGQMGNGTVTDVSVPTLIPQGYFHNKKIVDMWHGGGNYASTWAQTED